MTQIERGIPLPQTMRHTIREMKIGESFVFPKPKVDSIRSFASNHAKEAGKVFVTRRCPHGYRIWRTG